MCDILSLNKVQLKILFDDPSLYCFYILSVTITVRLRPGPLSRIARFFISWRYIPKEFLIKQDQDTRVKKMANEQAKANDWAGQLIDIDNWIIAE